ncbi:MAG: sarcosine oxidase subunit gamma [Candidatus Binatia bacterium]
MAEPLVKEIARLAQVDLRVEPGSAEARRIETALGVALPMVADSTACARGRDVLWLGPDEWLIIGEPGSEREIEVLLREAMGDGFASVVDVSANRFCLELVGAGAREVLASMIALDLHPRAFAVGRCSQTLLAKAPVILWHTDDAPTYRLLVRPSLASYATGWLRDAIDGFAAERAAR